MQLRLLRSLACLLLAAAIPHRGRQITNPTRKQKLRMPMCQRGSSRSRQSKRSTTGYIRAIREEGRLSGYAF